MAIAQYTKSFVELIVGVMVVVAIIPVIQQFIDNANLTGTSALLISLIPTFIVIGLIMHVITGVF